ncbi:MAG: ABC transporter ATP-binding protein [Aggregatilineales bacterium]
MQLHVENITATYEHNEGSFRAVENLSLQVQTGEFVALLGTSGSGKSTLLRIIAGLQRADSGVVALNGQHITSPHLDIAMMFQEASLMPWLTVRQNIALPLNLENVAKRDYEAQAQAILPVLGLEGFGDVYPAALSGGMAQRVALGRVLIQSPELLLLDEPFGALDALTRERISMDLLKIQTAGQFSVLMVTHDIQEAIFLADRVLVMRPRPGTIVANIPVQLPRPRTPEMVYTPEFMQLAKQARSALAG